MNQLETSLPIINETACNYAVLEFEINQILKEFECQTEINNTDERTINYLYKKLEIIYNQVKILKSRVKIAETNFRNSETKALTYKEELDILTDHLDRKTDNTSSLDSEWEKESNNPGELDFSQDITIEPNLPLINDYERKSHVLKLDHHDIAEMLGRPTEINKNIKNSFYPMGFLYANKLISTKHLSRDIFTKP